METEANFDHESMRIAVMHVYGFDFMATSETRTPRSPQEFLDICVIAEHYGIANLRRLTLNAAARALTGCLSGEDKEKVDSALKDFLGSSWNSILSDARYTPLLLRVLREHIDKLVDMPVFNKLLEMEPMFSRRLIFAMGKELGQRAR